MAYCTARQGVHICSHEWDYDAHPGDGTDHECHCERTWIDRIYKKSQRPCIASVVGETTWNFSLSLHNSLELGPVFNLWFGRRGIYIPLRWRPSPSRSSSSLRTLLRRLL